MYNLIRIINQNKRQILIAILAIVFVIVTIQMLNASAREERIQRQQELQNELSNTQKDTSTYNPSYSIATGEKVDSEKVEEEIGVIESFFTFCNNGEIEKAYNLLSDDCKKEIYTNINLFKQNYYETNFKTRKMYSSQLWYSHTQTYKVELYEDSLATGKIDINTAFEDYFTIVEENGQKRLNISEYIGKETINKSVTKNDITVIVDYKKIYKDYETYRIKVKNNTSNTILLDSMESTKNVYLQGTSGATYSAYIYEVALSNIEVKSYYQNTLDIKFNKKLTTSSSVQALVFADIILNEEDYKNNKKQYENRMEIEVGL